MSGPPGHLYLTGFMGSGKSTVGRQLATRLGVPFADLDERIEAAAGATVRRIFELHGEAGFRRLERRELSRVAAAEDPTVVATGGGVVREEENRRVMSATGRVVWLDLPFETLAERLGAAPAGERPLFEDVAAARRLYDGRQPLYALADVRVEVTAAEGPAEVVSRILALVDDKTCVT